MLTGRPVGAVAKVGLAGVTAGMRRLVVVLATSWLAAATVVACAPVPAPVLASPPPPSPPPVAAVRPVPRTALRGLPAGVLYILGAVHLNEMNLWMLTAGGTETQLTHNPPGYEIDAFGASRAGIVVADSLHLVDQLARWTRHGAAWLHPPGRPHWIMNGEQPSIDPSGQVVYELPPKYSAGQHNSHNADFTFWLKRSFTGPQRVIYWHHRFPGVPLSGPGGQVAVVGPVGVNLPKGQVPAVVFISRDGAIRRFRTPAQGYPPAWGPAAPAVAVPMLKGPAELVYPSGRRERLPAGWVPLAWDPGGTRLLVLHGATLGVWSLGDPGHVRAAAVVSRGFQISQACWLAAKAPI